MVIRGEKGVLRLATLEHLSFIGVVGKQQRSRGEGLGVSNVVSDGVHLYVNEPSGVLHARGRVQWCCDARLTWAGRYRVGFVLGRVCAH